MTTETIKHWKRRALKAEEELAEINRIRTMEGPMFMEFARECSRQRVAIKEAIEALQWGMEKEE